MPQVPAGDLTGIYYIIVAGLPWSCSWQRLKDFARNQKPNGSYIEIDHALVYPDSTDGWVRVKGKENFKEALAHLNVGVLEHRSIIADGRNENETVNLRDMVACRQPSIPRRLRNNSSTLDPFMPTPGVSDYQNSQHRTYAASDMSTDMWYLPNNPSSNGMFPQVPPPYAPTIYYAEPPQLYDPNPYPSCFSPQSLVYAGSMNPQPPIYMPLPPPPVYTYTYPIPYPSPPPPLPPPPTFQIITPPPLPIATVQTEAAAPRRTIIITALPPSTTRSEIHSLLTIHLSYSHSHTPSQPAIEKITTSQSSQANGDPKPRTHALVTLSSHAAARNLITTLDGMRFHGRVLGVRFANDLTATTTTAAGNPRGVGEGRSIQKERERDREREKEGGKKKKKQLRTKSCEPGLRIWEVGAGGGGRRRGGSFNTPLVVCSTGRVY